jgi:hypothetical protein
LSLKFAVDVWRDPQFCGVPEAIHFSGNMRSKLRRVDCQQGFIVGVCCGRRPVEAPRDHCFVVDHGALVVQLVTARKARAADALYLQFF